MQMACLYEKKKPYLSNTHSTHLVANFNALIERFASNVRSQKPTSESITSSVSINDVFVLQCLYGEDLHIVRVRRGDETRGFRTVGDHDDTGTGGV